MSAQTPSSGSTKVIGRAIDYPLCGDWTCEDELDWGVVSPSDPIRYRAVKREAQLVYYHQPRKDWRRRLQQERNQTGAGEPLWSND